MWNHLRFDRSGIVGVRSYLHFVRGLDGLLLVASELGEAVAKSVRDEEVHVQASFYSFIYRRPISCL